MAPMCEVAERTENGMGSLPTKAQRGCDVTAAAAALLAKSHSPWLRMPCMQTKWSISSLEFIAII